MRILLTGGAGYIGSHTYVALIENGHTPVILDSFLNSSPHVIDRLEMMFQRRPEVIEGDIRDRATLDAVFSERSIDAVIHFAGLKAVGESMAQPLRYFEFNVGGSERLLSAMTNAGCKKIVFSSSATVYGDPQHLPIDEHHRLATASVYGQTKLIVEDMLGATQRADPDWSVAILRYFNPVGAHPSGLIGEDPQDIPNNLMPYVSQVAVGRRPRLAVFGNDYDTPDGTGVRDYIHVCDLAEGHVAALKILEQPGCVPINLGTGHGYSVLDLIAAFERASGREIPYDVVDRRPGDVASCYADPRRAHELLDWRAQRDLEEMCADAWRWQSTNRDGYRTADKD